MNKALFAPLLVMGALILAVALVLELTKTKQPAIAIFTTLSHPALENTRTGFIDGLGQNAPNFAILDFNAEGNLQQANLIAQKIARDKNIVAIFAIGTLAAQTMAKQEKERPIVIAAVSDPNNVLPSPFVHNVCGLSDAISADYQLDILLKLLPTVKSVALLHSPAEANSATMVEHLRQGFSSVAAQLIL